MWREHLQREDGAGLMMAMLATLIISGIVIVLMTRTLTETRLTTSARDRETAIHVAEAGIDRVIVSVNEDEAYLTTQPDLTPHEFTPPIDADQATERAWAVGIASDPAQCDVLTTGGGQACGIRPHRAGTALPWIYGVGFVPSRDNPEKTRVIKVQFDKGFFSPEKAILTNGDLDFGGTICGDAADVHTNGELTFLSNPDTVTCADPDGNVTSTGTYNGSDPCPDGVTPTRGVGCDSGQVDRSEQIPLVRAATVYEREAAREARRDDPATTTVYEGTWFDLCPDGSVHSPLLDASGELILDASGNPQPCMGPELYASGDAAAFVGWSLQGPQNTWDVASSQVPDGVFYIHEADANIRGDIAADVNLTVVVDATGDIVGQPDTGDTCTTEGSKNGNLRISGVGGGTYSPFLQDLLFLADRDVEGQGNSTVTINGVILAHEQIEFGGEVSFTGAVVAEGACDSNNSPVDDDDNVVTGNFHLTHTGDLALPLDSVTRITAWNELF